MGNLCCCKKRNKKKIVLLLVGLDNAGKTVAAKGLAGESIGFVVPTIGFSVITLNYLNYIVKVFDLGGGPNIRGIWDKYFVDAHGVLFVVDASDIGRLGEAKEVLRKVLSHEKIARKPVLVLANKQDNEYALDEVDIIEQLDLESIVNGNKCPTLVESCSATDYGNTRVDPGIKKGFGWLLNYIVGNFETLNKRVEEDVSQQVALETQLRNERMEKIRARKASDLKVTHDEDAIESYSNYERKLNGQAIEEVTTEINYNNDSESENSSGSFPPVYHIKDDVLWERPKSVVQIVKQQLELSSPRRKPSFISKNSNKTVPLQLYGTHGSKSASLRRHYQEQRRFLKSAGDASNAFVDIPLVPLALGDGHHSEIFNLMKKATAKVEPKSTLVNGLQWTPKMLNGDVNGISIVDVD